MAQFSATNTASRRKRAEKPWVTDELLEKITHNRDLYDKWFKVRKKKCSYDETDPKGGKCPCMTCNEKRTYYTTYNQHKLKLTKAKYHAKLEYYGGECILIIVYVSKLII